MQLQVDVLEDRRPPLIPKLLLLLWMLEVSDVLEVVNHITDTLLLPLGGVSVQLLRGNKVSFIQFTLL